MAYSITSSEICDQISKRLDATNSAPLPADTFARFVHPVAAGQTIPEHWAMLVEPRGNRGWAIHAAPLGGRTITAEHPRHWTDKPVPSAAEANDVQRDPLNIGSELDAIRDALTALKDAADSIAEKSAHHYPPDSEHRAKLDLTSDPDTGLTREVDEHGTVRYFDGDGERHREDGPAIEWADGTRAWYRNGELHREDGPAIEWADGTRQWFLNGERHREDGPAIEWADGSRSWYLGGKRHREDGPAIEDADGTSQWFLNDERHREDGPAIEWADGSRSWFRGGKLHREDGPAVERSNLTREWYLDGKRLSEDEFEAQHPLWYAIHTPKEN